MFLAAPGTQRQQMTDASGAKWRHVKLPQKDNKSWLQPAAMKHRCSALNGNIQKKRPKWSIWCVLCCRVSSLLWTLCCVRQAGGRVTPAHPRARLSPYREGRRREGGREGRGVRLLRSWKSAHWASGWSWGPPAEVETQAGSSPDLNDYWLRERGVRTSAGKDDSAVQQKADEEVCFVSWSSRGDCILTIMYPYLELVALLRAKFGLQAHSVSQLT